jgi:predicted Rossmann-fold nucleotide-binding protein
MKVLVIGVSSRMDSIDFLNECHELGSALAELKLDLISGGGEGAPDLTAKWFKIGGGHCFTTYLPSLKEIKKKGEKQGQKPDKTILTKLDYPVRDIVMVKSCDIAVAIGGGLDTLAQIILCIRYYHKKVFVFARKEIRSLLFGIPELWDKVIPVKTDSIKMYLKKEIKEAKSA